MGRLQEFRETRERMNARIHDEKHLGIERFFALDTAAYRDGALPGRTKELCGLVASLVLRCDDCVAYHLIRCREEGYSRAEILDACNVGLVVGGSIAIPHLRRAVAFLDELEAEAAPVAPKPSRSRTGARARARTKR
jgi:AhpD family alkylhydroperoxidase